MISCDIPFATVLCLVMAVIDRSLLFLLVASKTLGFTIEMIYFIMRKYGVMVMVLGIFALILSLYPSCPRRTTKVLSSKEHLFSNEYTGTVVNATLVVDTNWAFYENASREFNLTFNINIAQWGERDQYYNSTVHHIEQLNVTVRLRREDYTFIYLSPKMLAEIPTRSVDIYPLEFKVNITPWEEGIYNYGDGEDIMIEAYFEWYEVLENGENYTVRGPKSGYQQYLTVRLHYDDPTPPEIITIAHGDNIQAGKLHMELTATDPESGVVGAQITIDGDMNPISMTMVESGNTSRFVLDIDVSNFWFAKHAVKFWVTNKDGDLTTEVRYITFGNYFNSVLIYALIGGVIAAGVVAIILYFKKRREEREYLPGKMYEKKTKSRLEEEALMARRRMPPKRRRKVPPPRREVMTPAPAPKLDPATAAAKIRELINSGAYLRAARVGLENDYPGTVEMLKNALGTPRTRDIYKELLNEVSDPRLRKRIETILRML